MKEKEWNNYIIDKLSHIQDIISDIGFEGRKINNSDYDFKKHMQIVQDIVSMELAKYLNKESADVEEGTVEFTGKFNVKGKTGDIVFKAKADDVEIGSEEEGEELKIEGKVMKAQNSYIKVKNIIKPGSINT